MLNKDLSIAIAGDYFGTMDFAADDILRNEFGRKGDIAGTGSVTITAPNVAVRCAKDDFTWGGRSVRLLNGASDVGRNAQPAGSLFMLRSLPMSRDYADVQISHNFVGEGTAQNPYLITSLGDYKKLENDINTAGEADGYKNKYFRLAADLDFTRFTEIPPIGGNTVLEDEAAMNAFCGTFDGAGHQLIGMKINGGIHSNVGVFGAVDGGTVKNLVKTGGYVVSLGTNTGGLVGRASNGSKIYSCYQTAPVSGSQIEDTAGGIVGVCETGSEITGCYNVGTVNKAFDANKIAEDEMAASVAREQENEVRITVAAEDVKEGAASADSSSEEMAVGGELNTDAPGSSNETAESGEAVSSELFSSSSSPESREEGTSAELRPNTSSEALKDGTSGGETIPEPEEAIPEIDDPFADFDFTGREDGQSAGKYVGGIAGYCDAASELSFCYSLSDACEQVVGKADRELSSDTVSLKTQEELRSEIMVETLNLSSPGAFKAGSGFYPYPWLNQQRYEPGNAVFQGKTIQVSLSGEDFAAIKPEPFTEKGDLTDPYVIDTVGKYKMLADSVMEGNTYRASHFVLGANFDFTGVKNVMPIGGNGLPFCGTFDGRGHMIYGLSFSQQANICVGLFGYVEGAEIINTGIESGSISGGMNVGGIAGVAEDSTIRACYNRASVTARTENAGGIIGNNAGSVVTGCYNTGAITAASGSGGVIGYNADGSVVSFCYSLDLACDSVVGIDLSDPSLTVETGEKEASGSSIPATTDSAVVPEVPEKEPVPLQRTNQRLTNVQMKSRKFVTLLNQYADDAFAYVGGQYPKLLQK